MKATMQKEGEKVTKPIISAMQIIGKYKKTIITAVAILIALPVLYGFISGAILKAQLKNAPQGELLFYTIRTKDIEDTKLKEWVETHYKVKGIHVYEGKKATNEKHVLLAAGEQKIPEISIELESVVGFRDKILINGKIVPPKEDKESGEFYPHKLIKIETTKDPRQVQLGTLNLFDVFRGIPEPINASLEKGIITKIFNDTIEIIILDRNGTKYRIYNLTEPSKALIMGQGLEAGDFISISTIYEPQAQRHEIESIRKTSTITGALKIADINANNKTINVEIHGTSMVIRYKDDFQELAKGLSVGRQYSMRIKKEDDGIYLTSIINL